MADRRKAPAPKNLGTAGLALWQKVTGQWTLRPDELRVLEDACREATLVDRIETELSDDDLIVRGSQGQPVINPLVSEVRQHRATLSALLRQLKLPDEDAPAEGESRSSQARDAAKSRWSVAHGKAS